MESDTSQVVDTPHRATWEAIGRLLQFFRNHPKATDIFRQMGMGQNPGTPGEPQNSWDLWMFIPLKMVCIGIDP